MEITTKTITRLAINGGEKACDLQWPGWPVWGDEERTLLNEVLESGCWWYGQKVREFEERFAEFQGAGFGITASSGTTALEAALLALGIGLGDEVIVPPYTFIATASAVLRVNAIPVFADIEPRTLCIDPDDVARKVTDRTRAIIPVHLAGYVADMDRLWEIARKHDLYILEDACHAWGSQWKGKGVGAIGHCGVFSFQASKNISSAEGGIILTDDENIADACRSYTNCGRDKNSAWYKHFRLGSNLRLTEFQGAILLAQLTRLESQTAMRQASAHILDDYLRDIPGIVTMQNDIRMTRRSHHFYPFRIIPEVLGVSRERFIGAAVAEGIPVTAGYPTPIYRNPLFRSAGEDGCASAAPHVLNSGIDYRSVGCPVCEQVCEDTCWVPHQCLLADEDHIRQMAGAIAKVCENAEHIG